MQGSAKNSKMVTLFKMLDEDDKDLVISLSESLVEKCKSNTTEIVSNDIKKKSTENVDDLNV